MKTNSTQKNLFLIATVVMLSMPFSSKSQNLLSNSDFLSGLTGWALQGMPVEINNENVYGGPLASNKVAEVDAQVGLRQKMAVTPGRVYTLVYKASRRTSGSTPASVGMRIKVTGDATGQTYINSLKQYNNSVFGYSTETMTFTVPATSADNIVVVEFTHHNNATTHGVIVDDIEMTSAAAGSLPVQFISFTAELKNEQSLLVWKTASEINNKHFIIERSANGNQFDSVGIVKASVNNGSTKSYSFTDAGTKGGNNFYRLRQVDVDGAYKYSKVVIVKLQKGSSAIKVFPTMASHNINFNLSAASATQATVSVYDAAGKMVIRTQKSLSAGVNQQSVDLSTLNNGTYYFKIQDNNGVIDHTQVFHKVD